MGNSPRDCGPGGQWLGFILSGRELSSWGVVLEPLKKALRSSRTTFC